MTVRVAPPSEPRVEARRARPLPVIRTSFVGRGSEIDDVGRQLADPAVRLVTIVGRSGVGKTRLAIEVARRLADRWPGGAVLVELGGPTGVSRPAEVVGAALGSRAVEGQAPEEAVRRQLRLVPSLVILDDVDEATGDLDELIELAALSPATRFLATSHAPTGHAMERVVRLRPLPLAPDGPLRTEALAEVPAVALYVQRAAAVDPAFVLDDANAAAVAELTRRLDGLPLAIELGAARARILSPSAHLEVLAEHSVLDLRAGRADDRPERHREVRTAVASSYALAGEREQALLRHMSVFAGGCSSERLRQVAGEESWTLAAVLDALVELVDLGLVEVDQGDDGEPGYRLLPTIAAFARERLEEAGEADTAARRHESVLRTAARKTRGLDQKRQVDALGRDANELHALFLGLAAEGRIAAALDLASDLGRLWKVRGLYESPGSTFGALLDDVERAHVDVPAEIEARAMIWWASLAVHRPTPARHREAIRRRLARGLELARALGDPALLLFALDEVVAAVFVTGDMAGVAAATAEGLGLARAAGDRSATMRFEYRAAIFALAAGDAARAAALAGSALGTAIEDGDVRSAYYTTAVIMGIPPGTPGMPTRVPSLEGLLESAERAGEPALCALILARIAAVRLEVGEIEAGAEWALRGLKLAEDLGAWYAAGFVIVALAELAAARGDAVDAARLHGTLAPIATEVLTGMGPGGAARHEAAIAPARAKLGPAAFDRLAGDAALLDRDSSVAAAAAYARSLLAGEPSIAEPEPVQYGSSLRPPPAAAGSRPPEADVPLTRLTPREIEILHELMTGATNAQIAESLGLRPKTVMHHSVAIYSKLGVRGRTEATAWAYRNGIEP